MSKGYCSVRSLCERALLFAEEGDIDQSLRLIHHFVERIITEPLCTSQVYGSKMLDDLCQYVGKANLAEVCRDISSSTPSQQVRPDYVYIVTKVQKSGGHTRVIEDVVRSRPDGQHVILSTELDGMSDVEYLLKGLATEVNVIFEAAPKASYQQRLTWLQQRLLESRPERVYLFNHHQDSVAVAAIQPEMGLDAWYYHHGDHHLCLGVYLSFLQHIDPHPMGYQNCRNVLGIENIYVPLAVDDKGGRSFDQPFMSKGYLTTCTAAKTNKIEKNYFISYLDVVPELLLATGGRHIHIGRLSPWAIFKIRKSLRLKGISADKFVYIPWVRSVWKTLQEQEIDLYISSFPIGGALTMIEAMGAAIPVAIHKHISSKFLSCIDLAYKEAFCWRYEKELIDYCASVTPEALMRQSQKSRKQYEVFHRREIFELALKGHGVTVPEGRTEPYSFEPDEAACMIERSLSFSRILYRTIYRLGKRIRARLWDINV